mmetsp:Transcript_70851/g.162354  ORF Transcript_70851/g.162354 Transcript_70851/m.162354 type:complete len:356 (-) Transcript_70851:174-1241(-)
MHVDVGDLAIEVHEDVRGRPAHFGDVVLQLPKSLGPGAVNQPLPRRLTQQLIHPVVYDHVARDQHRVRRLNGGGRALLRARPGVHLLREKLPPAAKRIALRLLRGLIPQRLEQPQLLGGEPLPWGVVGGVRHQVRKVVHVVCLAVDEDVCEVAVTDHLGSVPRCNLLRLLVPPLDVQGDQQGGFHGTPDDGPEAVASLPPAIEAVGVEEREQEPEHAGHEGEGVGGRLEDREPKLERRTRHRDAWEAEGFDGGRARPREQPVPHREDDEGEELPVDERDREHRPAEVDEPSDLGEERRVVFHDLPLVRVISDRRLELRQLLLPELLDLWALLEEGRDSLARPPFWQHGMLVVPLG